MIQGDHPAGVIKVDLRAGDVRTEVAVVTEETVEVPVMVARGKEDQDKVGEIRDNIATAHKVEEVRGVDFRVKAAPAGIGHARVVRRFSLRFPN